MMEFLAIVHVLCIASCVTISGEHFFNYSASISAAEQKSGSFNWSALNRMLTCLF